MTQGKHARHALRVVDNKKGEQKWKDKDKVATCMRSKTESSTTARPNQT